MPQQQGNYQESGATVYVSAAAEQGKQLLSAPGKLLALDVTNVNAATRYLYLFNDPAASGVLLMPPIEIPSGKTASLFYNGPACPCSIGAFAASSSTLATYTAAGADFLMRAVTK